MNNLHKLIRYKIALQLPFESLIQLLYVNKAWYKIHQESHFWLSKVNQDFPKLIIPYKNSNFKRLYQTELRREILRTTFKFVPDPDWCYGIPWFGPSEDLNTSLLNDMAFERIVSILSGIVGCNICEKTEISLYGNYEGYWFEIFNTSSIRYWLDKSVEWDIIEDFEKDLVELINISTPNFETNEGCKWSLADEYFGQSKYLAYQEFKLDPPDIICLITGSVDDVADQWTRFLLQTRPKKLNLTMVMGTYYGREFYVHNNDRGTIQLHVEPLLSNKLISDLITIMRCV